MMPILRIIALITLSVGPFSLGLPVQADAQARYAAINPIRCEQSMPDSLLQNAEGGMSKLLKSEGFRVIPSAQVRAKDNYALSECEQGSCLKNRLSALGAELFVVSTLWLRPDTLGNPQPHTLSLTVYSRTGSQAAGKAEIRSGDIASASTQALSEALGTLSSNDSLHIRIDGTPVGASVNIDGAVVGDLPWEGELAPGTHRLNVSMQGYAPQTRTLTIHRATPPTPITIRLNTLDADTVGGTSSNVRTQPSPLNYWLAGGLGAVGLALVAYGGVHALQDGDCIGVSDPAGNCDQRVSFGTFQATSLAVGGALIAAGVVVLIWNPLSVDVQMGKEHAAFTVRGEF